MAISGKKHEQLSEALRDAFRTPQRFTEFVKYRFNRNLYDITIADDLRELAYDLIEEADRENWIDELIAAARQSNPNNSKLFLFSQEYNLTASMPPQLSPTGALEKIIKQTNSFLDVNTWREKLGTIEAQVCRVEITRKDSHKEYGTGFLIAPNVAVTNYHVIESVINKDADYSDVILRFDYKKLANGKIINEGTEYRLKQDWLIDNSPYTENTLPTPDELDYALLRVDGEPGNQRLGEKGSPERGWVHLPQEPYYQFSPGTPLLIVQHPKAEPLKLAFDTDAIISINENGTNVRYKTNTQVGSSGSPCFDINWNLVALHHSGDPSWKPEYNAGTPFSAICDRLERQELLGKLSSGESL